ncbi:MAG: dTDP-4-dehydrorhamnose 3,5-epimerase [Balneolaceae bacterium]
MKFKRSSIEDIWIVEPKVFRDNRGQFFEAFREEVFKENGLIDRYVQDNISTSVKGTIRGLHYQRRPHAQSKLVMAVVGRVLDVAVDIRKSSPTFGKYFSAELSDENRNMMVIPPGFAHGFSVLSESATIYYKCSQYYHKESERGIRWNDPEIMIDWKVDAPILSEKDELNPLLKEIENSDLF